MRFVKDLCHVLIGGIFIVFFYFLSTKESNQQLIEFFAYFAIGMGVLIFFDIVTDIGMHIKVLWLILDVALVGLAIAGFFIEGPVKNDMVGWVMGIPLLYIIYFFASDFEDTTETRSIISFIGSIATRVAAGFYVALQFMIILHRDFSIQAIEVCDLAYKVTIGITAFMLVGSIVDLFIFKDGSYRSKKSRPAKVSHSSSSSSYSSSSHSGSAGRVVHQIASRNSKTYYQGKAIVSISVSGRVSGSSANFRISGKARSNGPIRTDTERDLYRMNIETVLDNVRHSVSSSAESQLGSCGNYYVSVSIGHISS